MALALTTLIVTVLATVNVVFIQGYNNFEIAGIFWVAALIAAGILGFLAYYYSKKEANTL
jgi:hypothetical protein